MASQQKRIATVESREDGFYVRINVFSDTMMASGRSVRRRLSTPTEIGPFPDKKSAAVAQQAFIDSGALPVIPPR